MQLKIEKARTRMAHLDLKSNAMPCDVFYGKLKPRMKEMKTSIVLKEKFDRKKRSPYNKKTASNLVFNVRPRNVLYGSNVKKSHAENLAKQQQKLRTKHLAESSAEYLQTSKLLMNENCVRDLNLSPDSELSNFSRVARGKVKRNLGAEFEGHSFVVRQDSDAEIQRVIYEKEKHANFAFEDVQNKYDQALAKITEDFLAIQRRQFQQFLDNFNDFSQTSMDEYLAHMRRVFDNSNNQMTATSSNQMEHASAKKLRKDEHDKENNSRPAGKEGGTTVSKASGTAFLRFPSKKDKDTLSKGQDTSSKEMTVGTSQEYVKKRRAKGRAEMPDIPIPKRLPLELIKCNDDMDTVTDGIDNLRCDLLPPCDNHQSDDYFNNPAYAHDIVRHLQSEEHKYIVNPSSFLGVKGSADVSPHMRSILIDWLVQVQSHLNLEQTTLHLTVRMLDQFTVKKKVALPKFQLVGITCLLIASKYEERFPPSMEKLCYLTDGTYTVRDILSMEQVVFQTLGFQIHFPTPIDFMDRFLMCVPALDEYEQQPARLKQVLQYLIDLALHDIHMVQWSASMVAAASLCLAQYIVSEHALYSVTHSVVSSDSEDDGMQISIMKEGLGYRGHRSITPEVWTPLLKRITGYSESDLMPCMMRVAKLLNRVDKSKYQGAHGKYKSNRQFGAVSLWPGLAAPKVKQLVDLQINNTTL